MNLSMNYLYKEDLSQISELRLPWEKLKGRSILISGARGLIASCLIDALMLKNSEGLNCKIYAIGRNAESAKGRFCNYWKNPLFEFRSCDVNSPIMFDDIIGRIDYVLHMASNTHPVAYATDPIGTIATNIIGTNNMLKFAAEHH